MSEVTAGGIWGPRGADGDRVRRAVDKLVAPSRFRGGVSWFDALSITPRDPEEEVTRAEQVLREEPSKASRRLLQLEAMLLVRLSRLERLLANLKLGGSSGGLDLDFRKRRRVRRPTRTRPGQRTGPTGPKVRQKVPGRLQRGWDAARERGGKLAQGALEQGKRGWDAARERGGKLAQGALEQGKRIWGNARTAGGNAATWAGNKARYIGSHIRGGAATVAEHARGIWGKAAGVGLAGAGIVGRLGAKALGPLGLGLGLYQSATDPSEGPLGTTGEYALNAWSGAATGAMIGSAIPGVGTTIGGVAGAGVGLAATYLARNWAEVKKKWSGLVDSTKSLAGDISSGIQGLYGSARDKVTEFAGNLSAAAKGGLDWMTQKYDEIKTSLAGVLDRINIPEKFLAIRNLIPSLMTRAANLFKKVGGAVAGAVSNPTGGAAPPPPAPHTGSNPPIQPRAEGSPPRGAPTRPGSPQSSSSAVPSAGPVGDTTLGTGNLSGLQTNGRVGTRGLTGDVTDAAKRLQEQHGKIVVTGGTEGGHARNGYHPKGKAVDVRINGLGQEERERLVENARRAGFTGIGLASNHLHLDRRPGAPVVFFEKGGRQVWGGNKQYWNDSLGKIQPVDSSKPAAPAEASKPQEPTPPPTPPTLSERTIKGYTGMPSAPKAEGKVDLVNAPEVNQRPVPAPEKKDAPATVPGGSAPLPAGLQSSTSNEDESMFMMDSSGLRLYKASELA